MYFARWWAWPELAKSTIANDVLTQTASLVAMNHGTLYATISPFEFNRVFKNEDFA